MNEKARKLIEKAMKKQGGPTIAEFARRSKVPRSTFVGFMAGSDSSMDNIIAWLEVIGCEIKIQKKKMRG